MIDINKIRVASPCSVDWETMSGDERARHCESCKLNVYNIARMTNAEVQHLVEAREGRLCIRLFRRPDGTVITKDCPVGLRAFQKRIAKFAGATLTVLFSLVGLVAAQNDESSKKEKDKDRVERKVDRVGLGGVVTDLNGASVSEVKIKLFATNGKKPLLTTKSDSNGRYDLAIGAGTYRLEFRSKTFKTLVVNEVVVTSGVVTKLNAQLEIAGVTVWVGIIAEEPMIDTSSSSVTTKITRRQIEGLPY